ncbi:hypothetical protein GF407_06965 [candidate division KSB1 bacterium]|nr:hypothetical protein [candidate division KSB1 bacterium]
MIISDFNRFTGGEHHYATSDTIGIGIMNRFENANVVLKANRISYNHPMDRTAMTPALTFYHNSSVFLRTTYFNLPVMTFGELHGNMSDYTSADIYACESRPWDNSHIS